jgi:hypothetical protein
MLEDGGERRRQATVAAVRYAAVFDRTGGYYPGDQCRGAVVDRLRASTIP